MKNLILALAVVFGFASVSMANTHEEATDGAATTTETAKPTKKEKKIKKKLARVEKRARKGKNTDHAQKAAVEAGATSEQVMDAKNKGEADHAKKEGEHAGH